MCQRGVPENYNGMPTRSVKWGDAMRETCGAIWRAIKTTAGRLKFWIFCLLNSDAYDCFILTVAIGLVFLALIMGILCLTYGPMNKLIQPTR